MNKKVHFKGLNGIRAIAALIVLIFHIDLYITFFGLQTIGFHKTGMASYGVLLFFVLSGYLITRLLLIEIDNFETIDLPKFYIRRMLRIWPIYYLVIFITFILYIVNPQSVNPDNKDAVSTFILYTFLLSNVGFGAGLGMIPIAPLWSVGVEEQFYAFWPWLLKNTHQLLKILLLVIGIYLSIKLAFRFFEHGPVYRFINMNCFDCMAIGGIGGYLVHHQSKYLNLIYKPVVQVIAWGFLIISILYKPFHFFSFLDQEIHSAFYLVIILNVSSNPKSILSLETSFFDFVGRISYGIYVYHMLVILFLSWLYRSIINYSFTNSLDDYILVYCSIIILTLTVSYCSYHYFEAYFLRLKHTYSKIESMPQKMGTTAVQPDGLELSPTWKGGE